MLLLQGVICHKRSTRSLCGASSKTAWFCTFPKLGTFKRSPALAGRLSDALLLQVAWGVMTEQAPSLFLTRQIPSGNQLSWKEGEGGTLVGRTIVHCSLFCPVYALLVAAGPWPQPGGLALWPEDVCVPSTPLSPLLCDTFVVLSNIQGFCPYFQGSPFC